jgi:hypothetical protein
VASVHQFLVLTMGDRHSDDGDSGRPEMAPGPFEGYRLGATDVPVRIFDLSVEGCLVELIFGTLSGSAVRLQIDLPHEGWIVVQCEMLHPAGHNTFAVKFVRIDEGTRRRIERAVARLLDRLSEDDTTGTSGEANGD